MREDRRLRAEAKKAVIRKEIFTFMVRCVDEKVPEDKVDFVTNAHIEGLKRRNPQENHLVTSVCNEIKMNTKGFCDKMMELLTQPETAAPPGTPNNTIQPVEKVSEPLS